MASSSVLNIANDVIDSQAFTPFADERPTTHEQHSSHHRAFTRRLFKPRKRARLRNKRLTYSSLKNTYVRHYSVWKAIRLGRVDLLRYVFERLRKKLSGVAFGSLLHLPYKLKVHWREEPIATTLLIYAAVHSTPEVTNRQ